jgi:hypothetical protein
VVSGFKITLLLKNERFGLIVFWYFRPFFNLCLGLILDGFGLLFLKKIIIRRLQNVMKLKNIIIYEERLREMLGCTLSSHSYPTFAYLDQ